MAFIEKRGNRWRVRYPLPPDEDGKVKYASWPETYATKTAAKNCAEEIEAAQRNRTFIDPRLGKVTFGEYVVEWLARKNFETPNLRSKMSHINVWLKPEFGDDELLGITRERVQALMTSMTRNPEIGARTVGAVYCTLRMIMTDAYDNERIPRNPCRNIDLPTWIPEEGQHIPGPDVLRLADAVGEYAARPIRGKPGEDDGRWRLLVLFAWSHGLRWGEAVGVRKKHFRLDVGEIDIHVRLEPGTLREGPPRKGASVRTIDAARWFAKLIEPELKGLRDDDLVFTSRTGKVLRPKGFAAAWEAGVSATSMKGLTFHDLRHTHKTDMDEDHIAEPLKKARMGHRDRSVPGIYGHTTDRMRDHLLGCLDRRYRTAMKERAREDRRRAREDGAAA